MDNRMNNPKLPEVNKYQLYNENLELYPENQNYQIKSSFIPHKQKIMLSNGIYIKQLWSAIELWTRCERQNKYNIYEKNNKIGPILYKAKEKSSCSHRNCLPSTCRNIQFNVKNISGLSEDPVCLQLKKNYSYSCFGSNRPEITIEYCEEGTETYLGKIIYPFNCFDYNFTIFDENNKLLFKVFTECCQCGIMCAGCGCERTEYVDLKIFDHNDNPIAIIKKRNKNCLKSSFTDADNYGVDFDYTWNWKIRSIMMATVLFIDYMIFESKKKC